MSNSQNALHQRQLEEVQAKLTQVRGFQEQIEAKMRAMWSERMGQLWQRVEGGIKLEEDKVKAKLEAERLKREEEERRRREAEKRARQEQELMIRQQDETMDTIAGTLNTIHEQAGLMGREIGEHNECVCFIDVLNSC